MKYHSPVTWSNACYFFLLGVALTACATPSTPPPIEYRHGAAPRGDRIGSSLSDTHADTQEPTFSQKPEFDWADNQVHPTLSHHTEPLSVEPAVQPGGAPPFVWVTAQDTLFSISQKYQVSGSDIIQFNHLTPPYSITSGQKLWLREPDIAPSLQATEDTSQATGPGGAVYRVASGYLQTPAAGSWSFQKNGKILKIHAPFGAPVKSAAAGEVIYSGMQQNDLGKLILVQHADKLITVYGHLESLIVEKGTKVTAGQVIGTVGQTGGAAKPQLHFEVRRGLSPLLPRDYLTP